MKTWHLPYAIKQSTDLRYIQKILGHNNIKTTIKYTKVARTAVRKIKNPLDNIIEHLEKNKPP